MPIQSVPEQQQRGDEEGGTVEGHVLETVDAQRLGLALQGARKRKGMTQEQAANVLDVARTTVVAIEKGDRRIKPGELLRLARAYGRQVSDLLMMGTAMIPAPQFRGPTFETDKDWDQIEPFIDEFQELCRQYLQLEQLVGSPPARNYPNQYQAKGVPPDQGAESIALQERNRLGLGDGPLPALRDLLEQDVGIRVFLLKLPARYSEIYWCTDELGGCMAVNRDHPEERRRWSMAHGYAHFLTTRYRAEVAMIDGYQRRPESERLADAFAGYFLMPTGGLTRRFSEITSASGKFTPSDLCVLAHYYGVSVEALALRLESVGLLGTGKWEELQSRGFRVREAQARLGLRSTPSREDRLPTRFVSLALEALEQELITETRFAHLLGLSIVEARELAETLRPTDRPGENSDAESAAAASLSSASE